MVHIYTTGKTILKFAISYMINPLLKFNIIFRTQVEKCLGCSFSIRKMKTIKKFLTKKNTSVMALIMIYENNGEIPKHLYRVLSCVVYTLIYNYVCIDYMPCQSKTLSDILYNTTFKDTSFDILLGIGIPELLMNLVSCHGLTKKPNSTILSNIIEHNSKQLSLIPNAVKLIINLIDQMDTYCVMVKSKSI